jgi:hypothetical protein
MAAKRTTATWIKPTACRMKPANSRRLQVLDANATTGKMAERSSIGL